MKKSSKSALGRVGSVFGLSAFLGAAAIGLVANPKLASADPSIVLNDDEVFQLFGHVNIPGGIISFDISWVDPDLRLFFLADRTNKAVDIIGIGPNNPLGIPVGGVFQLKPTTPPFAGTSPGNVKSGPNGILTIENVFVGPELWAGDGDSTVKTFSQLGGINPTHVISTGGTARADELCYDPKDKIVLIANDNDSPPFVSLIDTTGYQVIGKIPFDGTFGPKATNGIEQCVWDPDQNLFLVAVPDVNGTPGVDDGAAAIVAIDPQQREKVFETFYINNFDCVAPHGMAIGPELDVKYTGIAGPNYKEGESHQLLVGCNGRTLAEVAEDGGFGFTGGRDSVIVATTDPDHIVCALENEGGSDEVWFNRNGDRHYFLANGTEDDGKPPDLGQFLGVVDSDFVLDTDSKGNEDPEHCHGIDEDQFVGTTGGSTGRTAHSVAADPETGFVGLPIPATGGGVPGLNPADPGFVSQLCGGAAPFGCVAVFAASDNPIFTGTNEQPDE